MVSNADHQLLIAALGVAKMAGDQVGLGPSRITVHLDHLVPDGVHRDTESRDRREELIEVLVADTRVTRARDVGIGSKAAPHLLPVPPVDATRILQHHVPHGTFVEQLRDRLLHGAGLYNVSVDAGGLHG